MTDELLTEVLAAHADHLNEGGDHTEMYLLMFPAMREELAPLLFLAEQLKRRLAPVQARPAFVEALEENLRRAAQERLPAPPGWRERLVVAPHWSGERLWSMPGFIRLPAFEKRRVLMGAAAGGAGLAAAGVAAYMLRDRFFSEGSKEASAATVPQR